LQKKQVVVVLQTNGSGVLSFSSVSSEVKVWVNFNGTGTPAIRASLNVSSITDNGTGDYRVNFTNALTDANYAVGGSAISSSDSYKRVMTLKSASGTNLTTTSVRVQTGHSAVGELENEDCIVVTVIIVR
jgi:hypothetical protein